MFYFSVLPVPLLLPGPQVSQPQSDDEMRLGEYYLSHDEPGKAVSEFEAALKVQPENSRVFYNLGIALRPWGDPDGAETALRSALRFRPNFPEAHLALGLVLADRPGSEHLGLPEFELATAQNPSYAEAYYYGATSIKLTPRSVATCTARIASASSIFRKTPPKEDRPSLETRNPVLPRTRYSAGSILRSTSVD